MPVILISLYRWGNRAAARLFRISPLGSGTHTERGTTRGLSLLLPGVDLLGHLLCSGEEVRSCSGEIPWPFESVSMALCSHKAASFRAMTSESLDAVCPWLTGNKELSCCWACLHGSCQQLFITSKALSSWQLSFHSQGAALGGLDTGKQERRKAEREEGVLFISWVDHPLLGKPPRN